MQQGIARLPSSKLHASLVAYNHYLEVGNGNYSIPCPYRKALSWVRSRPTGLQKIAFSENIHRARSLRNSRSDLLAYITFQRMQRFDLSYQWNNVMGHRVCL